MWSKLLIVYLIEFAVAAHLPSFIVPCKRSDPEFDACVLKTANKVFPKIIKGNKNLGIPNLTPMLVPFAQFETGSLKFNLSEINVYDIEKIQFLEVKIDKNLRNGRIKFISPKFEVISKYDIGGNLFSFPIEGSGPSNITAVKPLFEYTFELDEVEKNGLTYAKFAKDSFSIVDLDRMYFQFENLFNGNEILANPIMDLFNKEWKDVYELIKKPLGQIVKKTIRQLATTPFNRLPKEEVFPN